MSDHLSPTTIKGFLSNDLAAGELLTVDDHIAQCPDCALEISSASAKQNGTEMDTIPAHVSYEILESYANRSLTAIDMEIADVHLERCDSCSVALDDLVRLRVELNDVARERSFFAGILKPAFLVPSFGALVIISALFLIWSGERRPVQQIDVADSGDVVPPVNETVEIAEDLPAQIDANSAPKAIVAIRDGAAMIEVDADGRVSGLALPAFEGRVRNALLKQEIAISRDGRDLTGARGVLMSGSTEGVPFGLVSPVGKVVYSNRPMLSWKALAGAEAYRVEIFDTNFNRVAESPRLTRTSWQPGRAVQRGKVYVWQVTATKEGVESKSPVRPAPDAKFKVIDTPSAELISAARRSGGSKLVLALAYAEAGLLDDAERELAEVARSNRNSEAIKKLLQKVKAAR